MSALPPPRWNGVVLTPPWQKTYPEIEQWITAWAAKGARIVRPLPPGYGVRRPLIDVAHIAGCPGFGPASGGWVECRCWRMGFDGNGDLVVDGRGAHGPDEIEDALARMRTALTSFAQGVAEPDDVQPFRL